MRTLKPKLAFKMRALCLLVCFAAHFGTSAARAQPNEVKPELVLQTGHSNYVKAVVFSPDGRWLASASFDGSIRIWDVASGGELRAITGHVGAVKAISCSPDGKFLATGGNDGTVRIWNVDSGHEMRKFEYKDGAVEAVEISPDGKWVAFGGSNKTIIISDVEALLQPIVLSGHQGLVTSLAYSPDGKRLISGSTDRTVRLWDLVKEKPMKTFNAGNDAVADVEFASGGEAFAAANRDMSIRTWTATNNRERLISNHHKGAIVTVAFAPGDQLISIDRNRMVLLSSSAVGSQGVSVPITGDVGKKGNVESAALSRDGLLLALGNGDGTVSITDVRSGQSTAELENHTVGFYGVAFSSDLHWLAAAGFDDSIKLWDLQTGQYLPALRGHAGKVTSVTFHPDNRRLLSGSLDRSVRVWDTVLMTQVAVLTGHTASVSAVSSSATGSFAVSGSADGTIGIWDLKRVSPDRFLRGHIGEVTSVAISPDERFIVSGGVDATVRRWDRVSGDPLKSIGTLVGRVNAVAISNDGTYVAAGGTNRSISLWEVETGRLIKTFAGHTGDLISIQFTPDGTRLVSAGRDRSVRYWNIADGNEVSRLLGHSAPVFSATVSADQRLLASASEDGSVGIWDARDGTRLATLMSLRKSEEWLVVTPDGTFDGSPAAWQRLSWRFEQNTFKIEPVEVFFSEFWDPGLLREIVAAGKPKSTSTILNKDRRLPVVKMRVLDDQRESQSDPRLRRVLIDVSQAPGGAKDVRLFRNGTLVKIWRGDVLKGGSSTLLEWAVPVVAGRNELVAYSFNADNVKSRDAVLTIIGPQELRRKGTLFIMSVGVNKYANTEFDLTYAVSDATRFSDEFRKRQVELNRFDRVDLILLTDEKATKVNILNTLSDLSKKTKPEDTVVLFFAGHGTKQQDRFYMIPHDIGYTGARESLTPDSAGLRTILSNSLSDAEIESRVEGIDAGHFLLIIDSCNSGQLIEASDTRQGPMNSRGLAQLAYEKGMYILTAAQGFQDAKEASRLGYGYLTYALVEEGLKSDRADRLPKDGTVLLREWLDFVVERVPQIDREEVELGKRSTRQLEREKSPKAKPADPLNFQRPKVFYRRERATEPFVVSRSTSPN